MSGGFVNLYLSTLFSVGRSEKHHTTTYMLAVHWTPVNETKKILKNGIRKTQKGLFCFPLTGHKLLDKWWVNFFNQCKVRDRKKYNGIIFRIVKEDLPAYFGHWIGATKYDDFEKPITDLKTLGLEYRETILWRMGEEIARFDNLEQGFSKNNDKFYLDLAEKEMAENGHALIDRFNSVGFMSYTFEDYQIVLSNSIPAHRIINVLPQGNEFGRVLRQKKKYYPQKHKNLLLN
jgi:hypothetical protein